MSNISKVYLIGNLGRTPEILYTPKGTAYVRLSVATNRPIPGEDGQKEKETSWHQATAWGKLAETCAKYLTKGSRIFLEGDLRQKHWTDKNDQERTTWEIHVSSVSFLGGGEPPKADVIAIPHTEAQVPAYAQ